MDVSGLRVGNYGTRFLLSGVDVFTRRGFLFPLRNKKGKAVLSAIKKLVEEAEKLGPIRRISSDKGREFYNRSVQAFFKEKEIKHTSPKTSVHANMVEAFNYSIQRLLYLHIATTGSSSYFKDISDLVSAYNNRYHRGIRMTPAEADQPSNHGKVLAIKLQELVDRHGEYFDYKRKRGSPKYPIDVGSLVLRVPKDQRATAFMKSYKDQFQNRVFEVVEKKTNLLQPLFALELMEKDGGPKRLSHWYYETELRKVNPGIDGDTFPRHRVLKTRLDKYRRPEVLLKFLDFSKAKYNCWMKRSLYNSYLGISAEKKVWGEKKKRGKKEEEGAPESYRSRLRPKTKKDDI